ncbi:glycoside hydrolase family 3 N-terminal domain-containing protein [Legionella sp. W05-934-2]|uniref:glycoside hydrolase family 3 N-terminal domain-containing protein n=1 Tax=Legionella sp. W05-934-2 TaxID=1198649 RepID=UPI003461E704
MSELKSLIAQTLLVGFEGADINEVRDELAPLIELNAAGFILFSNHFKQRQLKKNIVDYFQTQSLIEGLQAINGKHHPLPLLMAVDYEGGQVDRLGHLRGAPVTCSAKESARLPQSLFNQQAQSMADFCHQLGFNINFAPVVDLDLSNGQGCINMLDRSYGTNAQQVSKLAWQFMQPFLQLGIACCLKHFPGHGSAMGDTHLQLVDVSDTYEMDELNPFQQILHHQHPLVMVMTAHIINRNLDSTGLPSTLSRVMLNQQLRNKWHYDGVIVSDDLQMHALAHHYSLSERLAMAMNAGCDLLIIGNQMSYDEPMAIIDMMASLVNNGDISLSRLQQAADRVRKLRQRINNKEVV